MPREGVPYPSREICSLKCQIDALQRQINELMKSINGVEGDGQGNVSLISGDPAVVINNDAVQNQIEISLDPSELPAADVSSVNSQTGAVVLEATDIMAAGYNKNVERVLDDIYIFAAQNRTTINNEIYRSTNADSALQTNFNALQASIPGEAANAVANDPTVAQLVADMNDKVDVSDVSTVQDPDTIAKRNGSGRLVAADPASGATDKTLVTANWVSQTGDSAPNNVAHRIADETYTGRKTFDSVRTIISNLKGHTPFNTNAIDIRAVYRIPASSQNFNINVILAHRVGILIARLNINSSGTPSVISKIDTIDNPMPGMDIGIVEDSGYRYICYKGPSQNANYPQLYVLSSFYSNTQMNVTLDDTTFNSNDVTFKSFGIWS